MTRATRFRLPLRAGRAPWGLDARGVIEALWAVGAGLVSVAVAMAALRITPTELSERWSTGSDDGVLHYMLFTSATQAFSYGDNPDLGFPHGLNVFFSGQVDVASAIVMALLSLVIHSGFTLLNVFDLLSFFGIAVTGFAFFRALRVRPWIAALFAVLFAVAPYHFIRIGYGHAFIANYWAVPVAGILALVVAGRETDPFAGWAARASSVRAKRLRRILPPVVLALAVATTGPYYFVFAVIVVGGVWISTVFRALLHRDRLRTIAVPTLTLASMGVFVAVALVALGRGYGQRYAPYFTDRGPFESELYAGKLTSLLAPWTGTGVPVLGHLVALYNAGSPVLKSTEAPGTPIVAAAGLVLLMVCLVAVAVAGPVLSRTALGRLAGDPRVRLLGLASIWVFLFYVVSGFGIVVAVVVGPELRAWSRFSVFLILFGLAVGAIVLDRISGRRLAVIVTTAVIVVVALLDQVVGVDRSVSLDPIAATETQGFVEKAVATLPEGCGVVQLPLKSFPDSGTIDALNDYDEGMVYLYTPPGALRWSYGSVGGTRGWDTWRSATTPALFASRVKSSGACAIEVDMKGYFHHPAAWKPLVEAATGSTTPVVRSMKGRYLLFEVPGGSPGR